ncbi:MAG: glycosyltransferase [Proteobacteria bacterium]|nr:glycosyltransferase [Pseudomonadota bacterium]MBU1739222.1 glycosyltransferase [Pseudomonadota bacterium]
MHITHICPRFKTFHGGGEPVLLNLFRELSQIGIDNTVLTCNIPENMQECLDNKIKLRTLPAFLRKEYNNVLLSGFVDLLSSVLLIFFIERNTDAVCFHTEGVIPGLFFYKSFLRTKPTLYFCFQPPRFAYDTTKETAISGGLLGFFVPIFKTVYRPFDRAAVRKADYVATFSKGYKQWIEDIYGIVDVKVIPPGVTAPTTLVRLPSEISLRLKEGKGKTLICVGKLVTWKHVDRLIDIVAILKKNHPVIRLLVVGDGPCLSSLKKQVTDLHLKEEIIFCGYVESEKVYSYCTHADLMVLMEKNASFGLAIVEANSVGLPVMAFSGGGPTDIICPGKNGYLLDPKMDNSGIAKSISNHLGNKTVMQQMSEESKKISSKYTWRKFTEMFIQTLSVEKKEPINPV